MGTLTGIILAVVCVAAASQLVVTECMGGGSESPSNQPGATLNPDWLVQRGY